MAPQLPHLEGGVTRLVARYHQLEPLLILHKIITNNHRQWFFKDVCHYSAWTKSIFNGTNIVIGSSCLQYSGTTGGHLGHMLVYNTH